MTSSDKAQQYLSLKRSTIAQLRAAAGRSATMSAVVEEALGAWFARKGDDELELRFAHRLNRHSYDHAQLRRGIDLIIETLAQFIREMLTVNPPIAEGDEEARKLGRDRFAAFAESVGQQLGKRRRTLEIEEDEDEDEDEK